MSRRGYVVLLACFAVLGAMLVYSRRHATRTRILRVGYPLWLFEKDRRLLDPRNLEFVYEYYLLENLTLGLVRDSNRSPLGYEPGLAQSWERVTPTSWTFRLRPGLSWSDGTPIAAGVVAAHIESLSRAQSRHIVYLKGLRSVTISGLDLRLDFVAPVNDGLVHELSLADAALLHPDSPAKGWAVTSGPYFVESYQSQKRLVLRKNRRCPISDGPERVELLVYDYDNLGDFFESAAIDLLKVPLPSFQSSNPRLLSRAPQTLRGYPTWIYYLFFNPDKSPWKSAPARRSIAAIIDRELSGFAFADLARERQLIPSGYAGRLADRPSVLETTLDPALAKNLKVNLQSSFRDGAMVAETLVRGFARAGMRLKVAYAHRLKRGKDDADLQMSLFAGNQRDAMGSWQFMFSPEHGNLRAFRREVQPFFGRIVAAQDKDARERHIRALHEHVLSEAYAIPLFIESDVIVASNRVDLSRLNPFDLRMRFYDIRWK